jgi:selenocysteine-specific elongation factor
VSSKSGAGLKELKQTLIHKAKDLTARRSDGPLFMPIDRVFSMHGFGTVLTGTLVSGQLRTNDPINIVPDSSGRLHGLKVRGLQSHGVPQEEVHAGNRVAINLASVERSAIGRGQVVVAHQGLMTSRDLEVRLQLLPGAQDLKDGRRMQFHTGTIKDLARLRLLGQKILTPGESVYAKVHCSQEIPTLPGQHFILRGFKNIEGRGTTTGGGQVLAICPPRRKQKDLPRWLAELKTLDTGSTEQRIDVLLRRSVLGGLNEHALKLCTGLSGKALNTVLNKALAEKRAFKFDRERKRYLSADVLQDLQSKALELLSDHHQANPMQPGMSTEQLKSSLAPHLDTKIFRLLQNELIRQNKTVTEDEFTRLAQHRVHLTAELESSILAIYKQAGLTPPNIKTTAEQLAQPEKEIRQLLQHLDRKGPLTQLASSIYIDSQALSELKKRLVNHLKQHPSISTQEFKKMVGASRKHVIPLAEYFDHQKVTMRLEDKRILGTAEKS